MPKQHPATRNHLPKVLLVSPLPPPYGGIARWTRAILDIERSETGAELLLVNTAHRSHRTDDASTVLRMLTGVTQVFRVTASFFVQMTNNRDIDCIHINTSGSLGLIRDIVILSLARLFRIRSVLHLRFGRTPQILSGSGFEARLLTLALKLAETTISIDPATQSSVESLIGSARAVSIPNFIETDRYSLVTERPNKTALFLGSVTRSKGVEELLAAWSALHLDGWTLRLVGPTSPAMERSLAQAGTDIEVIGPVEHEEAVAHLYDAAFLILPSHTEGFPNVVLEGMATGTPIIASAVGAIPQMLADGAGVVLPPRDIQQLSAAIQALAVDPELRQSLARRAHARVVEQYSSGAVLAQYRQVWASR